jgi:hypothetical protein
LEKIFEGGKREGFQPQRTKGTKREGRGRDVYIVKHENRFADRNALGERMGGDNLDNSATPPSRSVKGG